MVDFFNQFELVHVLVEFGADLVSLVYDFFDFDNDSGLLFFWPFFVLTFILIMKTAIKGIIGIFNGFIGH